MPTRPQSVSFGSRAAKVVKPADYGDKRIDREGVRGSAHARGYSRRWQKARLTKLAQFDGLCQVALRLHGRTEAAEVVDHWYPHSDVSWLFWITELWVPMSAKAHNEFKQSLERRGEVALDEYALRLGLPVLSVLEPVRVAEWREAFAKRGR